MPIDKIDHRALDKLLDELDIRGRTPRSGDRSDDLATCQRRHRRTPFRVGCTVYFFPVGSSAVGTLTGRTRNLSRSGVGLLLRRVFSLGDPLEVKISVPDRPDVYMAGLVTFCRYAGQGFHEVGVTLKKASGEPVFSKDPAGAVSSFEWLKEALVQF